MDRKQILGWVAVPLLALALVACGQKDDKAGSQKQGAGLSQKELSELGTKVLKDTYKKYDDKKGCWITEGPDKANYCMKVASVESVMTDEGEKVYLLATGENVDAADGEKTSGMVGMFELKPENGEYKVLAKGQNTEPTTPGKAPEGTFVRLGKNVYGWQIEKTASSQGQNMSGYSFYTVQNNEVKDVGSFSTVYDDSAMSSPDAKTSRATRLEGKVEVDKTDENAERYPMTVTVSGEKDGKKLSPRRYAIQFSSQKGKYVPPTDYPIAE